MVQTRTRSFSETSSLPTQPLWFCASRSNSCRSALDHSVASLRAACLSVMDIAIGFLQGSSAGYIGHFAAAGDMPLRLKMEAMGQDRTRRNGGGAGRRALII